MTAPEVAAHIGVNWFGQSQRILSRYTLHNLIPAQYTDPITRAAVFSINVPLPSIRSVVHSRITFHPARHRRQRQVHRCPPHIQPLKPELHAWRVYKAAQVSRSSVALLTFSRFSIWIDKYCRIKYISPLGVGLQPIFRFIIYFLPFPISLALVINVFV